MKNKSVKEIKEIVDNLNEDQYVEYIQLLNQDDRKSVQNIAKSLGKKLEKIKKEEERLEFINTFENEGYANGYLYIGGVDEAGRGPLAGPVVASVVVFEKGTKIPYINDSKKLSEAKRDELFDIIKEQALDYGIGIVENDETDYLLLDAVTIPDLDIKQFPIIKGDSKSISIAGASILAKVTRDRLMYKYDEIYPQYGFKHHKGYGTKEHYEAIEKYGITPIHRKSFLKNVL